MGQFIVFISSILFICLVLLIFKNKKETSLNLFLKIITLVFGVITTFKYFLSDSFIFVINGSVFNNVFYDKTDVLQTIIRWGYNLNFAVLPMAIFFDSRLFKNIASYVCLPFSVLSAVYFNHFMAYYLSTQGLGLHFTECFRYLYFVLELTLAISIPVIMQIKHKHLFNVKDKKEWLYFFLALPFIILLVMPPYVPQSLFGFSKVIVKVGAPYHYVWAGITVALIIALYYLFRFKDYKTRYMLCVFLTIVLFYHYNSIFLMGFTLPRLPIQLCNLAAYIYMIAIPFKRQKLFGFCALANIAGALVAFILSDFSVGAFGFWNMHFLYEHSLVLIIPVLTIALRIFPRINKKAIKYSFIGFSIYFVFCLVLGTILNGYSDVTGTRVNYFFLFDLNKAFSYFPILTKTGKVVLEFGRFELYPIVALIIYSAFTVFYLLIYYLLKKWYVFEDDRLALRESAIEIYEKITKRKSDFPRGYTD